MSNRFEQVLRLSGASILFGVAAFGVGSIIMLWLITPDTLFFTVGPVTALFTLVAGFGGGAVLLGGRVDDELAEILAPPPAGESIAHRAVDPLETTWRMRAYTPPHERRGRHGVRPAVPPHESDHG